MRYSNWILSFVAALTMTTMAQAAAYYTIQGRGMAMGSCNGGPSWSMCVDNIERRAESDTRFSADNQCRGMKGQIQNPYPTSCWNRCNPMFEPPNNQYRSVTCNADCNYTCVVR